jgi:hypothetical protein
VGLLEIVRFDGGSHQRRSWFLNGGTSGFTKLKELFQRPYLQLIEVLFSLCHLRSFVGS